MDVEEEERDESRSSTESNIRRRVVTNTSTEEPRMDDGKEEGDGFRNSTAPNARRRIVTKTPLEENTGDERAEKVTTQESSDGIREKAMRIASIAELETGSSARMALSPGRAEIDKKKKAKELVRALVGSITEEEGDIVVASDSKSKLWKDVDLKRAMQNWNMKYVDIARSPESAKAWRII